MSGCFVSYNIIQKTFCLYVCLSACPVCFVCSICLSAPWSSAATILTMNTGSLSPGAPFHSQGLTLIPGRWIHGYIPIKCQYFFGKRLGAVRQCSANSVTPCWVTRPQRVWSIRVQRWGLLKFRSSISLQASFSISQKYLLHSLNLIHIWQVSRHLSNMMLKKIGKITERRISA